MYTPVLLMFALLIAPLVHAEDLPFELQTSLSRTHISPGVNSTYFYVQPSIPSSGTISVEDDQGNEIQKLSFDSADYFDLEWSGVGVAEGTYTFIASADGREERKTVTVDATPPVISLAGEALIHHSFEIPWSDPGVTTNEGTLTKESNLSISRIGTSTITYSAFDLAGNRSQVVRTILIEPREVPVMLSNLTHIYDGAPKSASVVTDSKLAVETTYNGNKELPVEIGTYAVQATITTNGYVGSAEASFTIAAPGTDVTVVHTETERIVEKQPSLVEEVYEMLSEVNSFNLDIEELQRALIRTGHLAIPAPTGIFGPLTQTAVRFYQLAHKLPATGYVDTATLSALEKEKIIDENVLLENLKSILGKVEELASKL